jgi:dTDP-glucose pyrophosphorylase
MEKYSNTGSFYFRRLALQLLEKIKSIESYERIEREISNLTEMMLKTGRKEGDRKK